MSRDVVGRSERGAAHVLRELFDHHLWATRRLMEHLRDLPAGALEATADGVYGSVASTLAHLVAADGRYQARLEGRNLPPPAVPEPPRPLDDLLAEWSEHAAGWEALLDRLEALDVTLPPRRDWAEQHGVQALLLGQALHHGNDHRTQICTVLSVNGFDVPTLDGWEWWDQTRLQGERISRP